MRGTRFAAALVVAVGVLLTVGRYTFLLDPQGRATGSAQVRLAAG